MINDERSTLYLRLPHELHESIRIASEMSRKSMNQWACDVLSRAAESDHSTSSVTKWTAKSEVPNE